MPLDVRALGFWLKGLFGASATADNGDGTFDHVFTSGGTLPSLAIEIGPAQLAASKFFLHGAANAGIGVIAQGETETAATIDASLATFALKRFSQGSGTIRGGGGQLSFSNNLERVETIRADGLIDRAIYGDIAASHASASSAKSTRAPFQTKNFIQPASGEA